MTSLTTLHSQEGKLCYIRHMHEDEFRKHCKHRKCNLCRDIIKRAEMNISIKPKISQPRSGAGYAIKATSNRVKHKHSAFVRQHKDVAFANSSTRGIK